MPSALENKTINFLDHKSFGLAVRLLFVLQGNQAVPRVISRTPRTLRAGGMVEMKLSGSERQEETREEQNVQGGG